MKKKNWLFLGAVLVLASASIAFYFSDGTDRDLLPTSHEYSPTVRPSETAKEISKITLHRYGCFGSCPVYTVTFTSDGIAKYVGERSVERIGSYAGQTGEFLALATWIESQGFLNLDEDCPHGATDSEVVTTSIVFRGRLKSVTVCDSFKAPKNLQSVHKAIDDVSSRVHWHKQA